MRRHRLFLLSAWLLACGTAPLAAIEYHSQPEAADLAAEEPLEVVQGSPADDAGVPGGEPDMLGGCCDSCCKSGCDGCGCLDGCYPLRSWIVRADVLWMDRQKPNDNVVYTDANGLRFDASQIQFEYEAGFDVSLMEVDPHGKGTEFRYMWVNDFTETQQFVTLDPVLQTNPVTDQIDGVNLIDLEYNSQLKSMELHRLYPTNYGTLLLGARYYDLDEQLGFRTTQLNVAGPLLTQTSFYTRNDLIGLQVGYGVQVYQHDCWNVQVLGKAGVFHNDVDSDVLFVSNAAVNSAGTDASDEVAFATELRMTLTYQFSPGWAARIGYQFLHFDGVALATEQIATTANVIVNDPIPTQINLGTVYYHGGFAGLEYNF